MKEENKENKVDFPSKLPFIKSKREEEEFVVHTAKRKFEEESIPQTRQIIKPKSTLLKSTASSAARQTTAKTITKTTTKPISGLVSKSTNVNPSSTVGSVRTTRSTTTKPKPGSRNLTSIGSAPSVKKPINLPPPKKKRKEYDVKGRLQDLEEQYGETADKLEQSTALIDTMTDKLDKSESTSIIYIN
jgi:hypothetical protein